MQTRITVSRLGSMPMFVGSCALPGGSGCTWTLWNLEYSNQWLSSDPAIEQGLLGGFRTHFLQTPPPTEPPGVSPSQKSYAAYPEASGRFKLVRHFHPSIPLNTITLWLWLTQPWYRWPIEIDGLPFFEMVNGGSFHGELSVITRWSIKPHWIIKKISPKIE